VTNATKKSERDESEKFIINTKAKRKRWKRSEKLKIRSKRI
jgi:hypothetical protein